MSELLKISRIILESINRTVENVKDDLGKKALKLVRDRVKSGYGVTESGNKRKLDSLKPSTKRIRANNKRLASDTTPSTSNFTETGETINALSSKNRKNKDGVSITVGVGRKRNPGKRIKNNLNRRWLDFTTQDESIITNSVAKELIKTIEAGLRKLK